MAELGANDGSNSRSDESEYTTNFSVQSSLTGSVDSVELGDVAPPTCSASPPTGDADFSGSSVQSSVQSSSVRSEDYEDTMGSMVEDDEPLSSGELSDLQKEGDMPIEELLAVYGCPLSHTLDDSSGGASLMYSYNSALIRGGGMAPQARGDHNETYSSSEEEILSNQDLTLDKDEIARDLLIRNDTLDHETSVNDLITIIDLKSPGVTCATSHHLKGSEVGLCSATACNVKSGLLADQKFVNVPLVSGVESSSLFAAVNSSMDFAEDESDDSEYLPDNEDSWKKTVSVGAEFQATIPDLISRHRSSSVHAIDEHLLWDPSKLSQTDVEVYCQAIQHQTHLTTGCSSAAAAAAAVLESWGGGSSALALSRTSAVTTKDDEQALYCLMQCNYDVDEAIRRKQMEHVPPSDPLSLWSADEKAAFVNGLKLYGKDFYSIHQQKVRTRSVSELVQYYYLWKKTSGQQCTSANSKEKKKVVGSTTAGDETTTNYPIEDAPSGSTPGIHSLLYTDPHQKRGDQHQGSISDDVVHAGGGGYSIWPQHDYSRSIDDGGSVDFLAMSRPNFGVISLSPHHRPVGASHGLVDGVSYHEPYADISHALVSSPYHTAASVVGDLFTGDQSIDCRLGLYHDTFDLAATAAVSYNEVCAIIEPTGCSLVPTGCSLVPTGCSLVPVYYHQDSYSDSSLAATATFPDALPYLGGSIGRYYPSLMQTSTCDEAVEFALQSHHHMSTDYACHVLSSSSSCSSPPPLKRFKPATSVNSPPRSSPPPSSSPPLLPPSMKFFGDIPAARDIVYVADSTVTNNFAINAAIVASSSDSAELCEAMRYASPCSVNSLTRDHCAGGVGPALSSSSTGMSNIDSLQTSPAPTNAVYTFTGMALQNVTTKMLAQ